MGFSSMTTARDEAARLSKRDASSHVVIIKGVSECGGTAYFVQWDGMKLHAGEVVVAFYRGGHPA
jgi:hypothetical protein